MADKIILKGYPNQLKPLITHLIAVREIIEQKDIGAIYEAPEALSDRMTGRPEVQLVFREDSDFRKGTNQPGYHGQNRKKGCLSFRLMNETSDTISKAELTQIGTKIKDLFGSNGGYVWEKGKDLYSYSDWSKGYHLKLLCRSESYAKQLITTLLSVQNHTPDWKRLFHNENSMPSARYPQNPGTKVIAGEVVQIKASRPLTEVRFQYAIVHLKERTTPITLYDRRQKRVNSLTS